MRDEKEIFEQSAGRMHGVEPSASPRAGGGGPDGSGSPRCGGDRVPLLTCVGTGGRIPSGACKADRKGRIRERDVFSKKD